MSGFVGLGWQQAVIVAVIVVTILTGLALLLARQVASRVALRHHLLLSSLIACAVVPMVGLVVTSSQWTPVCLTWSSRAVSSQQTAPDKTSSLLTSQRKPDLSNSWEGGASISSARVNAASKNIYDYKDSSRSLEFELVEKDDWLSGGAILVRWELLLVIWFVGALAHAIYFLRALYFGWKLRLASCPLDLSSHGDLSSELRSIMSSTRQIAMRTSSRIASPVVQGVLRPVVLLPHGLMESISASQLSSILIHEFAHVQRRDNLVLCLQAWVLIWFWPLPWVRYLIRELASAREEICDNYVLKNVRPTHYVESLLAVVDFQAGKQFRQSGFALGILNRKGSALERRVRSILDPKQDRSLCVGRAPGLALLLVVVFSTCAIAALRFQEDSARNSSLPFQPVGPLEKHLPPKADANLPKKKISAYGVAKTADGKPVVGAEVLLVTCSWSDKIVGRTKTNEAGEFSFESVNAELNSDDDSALSVTALATKADLPVAWSTRKVIQFGDEPQDGVFRGGDIGKRTIWGNRPAELNITFGQPTTMYGQVTAEDGGPLRGAAVELRQLDYLDASGKDSHVNFRELNGIYLLPEKYRKAQTDDDGTFKLGRIPLGTYALVSVSHPKHATKRFFVANVSSRKSSFERPEGSVVRIENGKPVDFVLTESTEMQVNPVLLELAPTTSFEVTAIDEQGRPLEGMKVFASSKNRKVTSDAYAGLTDAGGKASLQAAQGEYVLSVRPPRKTDRVEAKRAIEIDASGGRVEILVPLGGIVVLKAIDKQTGDPIEGIAFGIAEGNRTTTLTTVPHYVDHPKTNSEGELTVLLPAGKRRLDPSLLAQPDGYRSVKRTQTIQVVSGEVIEVTFQFTR
ncbi:MAG: M56 family metallopeptidase [Planctomycetota bacterium]